MADFDLNVERVLEHWTIAFALRELIANALDEAALTATAEPTIGKDAEGTWHVRDFGRGLRYEHLTQKENREKKDHAALVVGKFGVGLKDALATLDRKGARIRIRSRYADMTLARLPKHGFESLKTLHVSVDPPSDPAMVGTDAEVAGIRDADVDEAKALFLRYSGDEELERTQLGAVLRREPRRKARIYVKGLRVAEEENFLFSYDITSLTAPLQRALNRERTNVGRTAYTDRVKAILLGATSDVVANALAEDLAGYATGRWHDETSWIDVAVHACRVLNAAEHVIFLTASEIAGSPAYVDRARADGYRIIAVHDDLRRKLAGARDAAGNPVVDLGVFRDQWRRSFTFSLVDPSELTPAELAIYQRTSDIVALAGSHPRALKTVAISETMRINESGTGEVLGYWDPTEGRIVVKRSELASLIAYAGTLLHEITHARSGTVDLSIEFEEALTKTTGAVASTAL